MNFGLTLDRERTRRHKNIQLTFIQKKPLARWTDLYVDVRVMSRRHFDFTLWTQTHCATLWQNILWPSLALQNKCRDLFISIANALYDGFVKLACMWIAKKMISQTLIPCRSVPITPFALKSLHEFCNKKTTALALLALSIFISSQALARDKHSQAPTRSDARGVALVVGNARYPTVPLRNPVNDAVAIGESLQGMGYVTQVVTDTPYHKLKKSIAAFSRRLRGADIGVFYYSGHGIQYKGKNYIIPVNAQIESEGDIPVEGVSMNYVFSKMAAAKTRVNIIILDACRNNPFARSWSSTGTGLAVMNAPAGTLIAYATAPGQVALDGDILVKNHSIYTAALLQAMNNSESSIEDLFKEVRRQVREASNGRQIPWESTSLEGEVVLKPGGSLRRKNAAFYEAYAKDWPQIDDKELNMQRLAIDKAFAKKICHYQNRQERWTCASKQLQRFPLLYAGSKSSSGEVQFLPMRSNESNCIDAVLVKFKQPEKPVTVNWDMVSFIINGAASPARVRLENAGFKVKEGATRGFHSVSTAPVGSDLRAVLTVPDGSCLLPLRRTSKEPKSSVTLVVPFLIGKTRNSSKWRMEWRRESISLATALAAYPRPKVSTQKLKQPGSIFPVWSVTDTALVLLASASCTGFFAVFAFPASTGSDIATRLSGGLEYGAWLGGCLLLPSLPLAMLIDGYNWWSHKEEQNKYDNWLLQKRMQLAYNRVVKSDHKADHKTEHKVGDELMAEPDSTHPESSSHLPQKAVGEQKP